MSRPVGFHHTEETKRKLSLSKLGKLNPMHGVHLVGEANGNWKGGRCILPSGYILIYKPSHPHCDKDGYVLEHRLIMEEHIGRFLGKSEIVHHINGLVDDNRPENLKICENHSEHIKIHANRRFSQ